MLQFGEVGMESLQKSLYAWFRVFLGREFGLDLELTAQLMGLSVWQGFETVWES